MLLLRRSLPSLIRTNATAAGVTSLDGRSDLKISKVGLEDSISAVKIFWEDGKLAEINYNWLQDCTPPATVEGKEEGTTLGSDDRLMANLYDFTVGLRPEGISVLPDGDGISVIWPPYKRVTYSSEFLRNNALLQTLSRKKDVRHVWDQDSLTEIPTLTNAEVMREGASNLKDLMLKYGFCVVTDCLNPTEITDEMGDEYAKPYGGRCHISNANSVHTGAPFLNPIRNVGVLMAGEHISEGYIQLVDGLKVGQILETHLPFIYHYLSTVNVDYVELDRRYETNVQKHSKFRSSVPVFTHDDATGEVRMIAFNNSCRVTNLFVKTERMARFYSAMKAFNHACYNYQLTVESQPRRHDAYFLDNWRVLHGTTAFHGPKEYSWLDELFCSIKY